MSSILRFRGLASLTGLSLLAAAGCMVDQEPVARETAVGRSAQAVSSAVKDACSFSYTAAPGPLTAAPIPSAAKGFAGSSTIFADVTGDGKSDLVAVTAIDTVTTYVGNGNGTFTKGLETKLPAAPTGKSYVGLGLVANGDFDGDGKADVALVSTTAYSQYPNGSWFGRFVFLYGSSSGALQSLVQTADVMTSGGGTAFHIAQDFDGDGRADFFFGNYGSQSVMFANAGRTFTAASSVGSGNPGGVVALPGSGAAGASLFFTSSPTSTKISWSTSRTKSVQTLQAPSLSAELSGDLDGDGKLEFVGKGSGSPNTSVRIGTVDTTSSLTTLYGFNGYLQLVGVADLIGDGKKELLYVDDADVVFAACGYTPGATDLVAVPLGIDMPYGVSLLRPGDLNGDGKADLIRSQNGAMTVYLSGAKPAQPIGQISLSSTPPADPDPPPPPPKADAGTSKPKRDAGTTPPTDDPDPGIEPSDDSSADPGVAPARPGTTTTTSGCAQAPISSRGAGALSVIGLAFVALIRRRRTPSLIASFSASPLVPGTSDPTAGSARPIKCVCSTRLSVTFRDGSS